MLIKTAASRDADLEILQGLLERDDLSPAQRAAIDREIRTVRAGERGEQAAAYELDFHYGATSTNYAVLHDLRIEHEGRVAQIDHLVIDRYLDVWVCESKHFAEGLAINAHGEWVGFHQSKPFGIASPIEQNRKHIKVLDSLLRSKRFTLPTRLGFAIVPRLYSVVLVSKQGRITRPPADANVPDLDALMKVDQFYQHQQSTLDNASSLSVVKVIGRDTLQGFAQQLARHHRPLRPDWAARFGLVTETGGPAGAPPGEPSRPQVTLVPRESNGWEPLGPRVVVVPVGQPQLPPSRPFPAERARPETSPASPASPSAAEATTTRPKTRPYAPAAPRPAPTASLCDRCDQPIGADVVRFCRFNKMAIRNIVWKVEKV